MTAVDPIIEVVSGARRRSVVNLVVRQAALCVIAFLAAFITLLLLGTQVVHWAWPIGLGLLSAVLGWFGLAGKLPQEYEAARALDARLALGDLLSTAWHFLRTPEERRPCSRFLNLVSDRAARAVRGVRVADAIPVHWPREAWIAAAMVATSLALLGVRYGVLHTLDLTASLVEVKFDPFTGMPDVPIQKKRGPGLTDDMPPLTAMNVEEQARHESKEDPFPEDALKTVDVPDPGQQGVPMTEKKREGAAAGEEGPDTGETGEQSEPGEGAEGDEDSGPSAPPSKDQEAKKGPPQNKEANSMLDKMRDAFNNMMDKLNLQPKGNEGQQKAGSQSKQQNAKGEKGGEKGQQMSKTKGEPNSQSESDQPGEASDQAQGNNKSQGDKQDESSNDPRSGMGKQDGKKDTELAEQLEAMGKISEILGKRSANITGEMMVEVQNSKQQLRTQYVNRKAAHGESGGEVNRDEIPLHLQQYVQQYYEQVRKSPGPPPSVPVSAPPKPPAR